MRCFESVHHLICLRPAKLLVFPEWLVLRSGQRLELPRVAKMSQALVTLAFEE